MKISVTTIILLCALNLAAIEVHAQTVYKWVDTEGVTHYSDLKPANDGALAREVEITSAPVSKYDSKTVTERINNQLQQMREDREAHEREREAEAESAKKARVADEARRREPIFGEEKKKNRHRNRNYRGPFPKPFPRQYPERYPQLYRLNPPGS
jgi:hypothetical protein